MLNSRSKKNLNSKKKISDVVQFIILSSDKATNITYKSGLLSKREVCILKRKKKSQSTMKKEHQEKEFYYSSFFLVFSPIFLSPPAEIV